MKLKSITGTLVAVGALLVANPASADLVFYGSHDSPPPGDQITYDATDDRGSLDCLDAGDPCTGLLSTLASGVYDPDQPDASTANGFSATDADLFVLPNSNPATETAFVEDVLNIDLPLGVQTQMGGGDAEFCTNSEWILFKIGADPDYALVHNTGGIQCFEYTGFTGEGAGLSHITTFGNGDTFVSEPNVLALFGLSLLMLGFLRRKTTA